MHGAFFSIGQPDERRERPRVTETGELEDFTEMLKRHGYVAKKRVTAKQALIAIPEVDDDLALLDAWPGAGAIGAELARLVNELRAQEPTQLPAAKALDYQNRGDLSDLMKRKFDAPNRGKGNNPRFRLILRPNASGWTVIAALPRLHDGMPKTDLAYEEARKRLSRLSGARNTWLLDGNEHRSYEFVIDAATRRELWDWLELEQDPHEPEHAGQAERFQPSVAVTAYPCGKNDERDSLTFLSFVHSQRECDIAIAKCEHWLKERDIEWAVADQRRWPRGVGPLWNLGRATLRALKKVLVRGSLTTDTDAHATELADFGKATVRKRSKA